MKKVLSGLLCFMLLFSLAACGNTSKGIYTPGTYTASATGMSTVTVTVTVDANKITDVQLDLSGETAEVGQAAGETLKEQILSAQSSEIDGVSGATLTTTAVKVALTNCLMQAKGESTTEKAPVPMVHILRLHPVSAGPVRLHVMSPLLIMPSLQLT